MGGHAAFEALVDLAEVRAGAAGAAGAEAARHAAGCVPCADTLAWLRTALGRLAEGAAAEPPRAVLRRALQIPAAARVRGAVDAVRTLVARLVFDSGGAAPAPALAFRGGGPRQLLYRAGPWDLDLSLAEGTLRGSLLPREEREAGGTPRGTATLRRGRRTVAEAVLDARGRFALAPVPSGRFSLLLRIGGDAIRVREIDL